MPLDRGNPESSRANLKCFPRIRSSIEGSPAASLVGCSRFTLSLLAGSLEKFSTLVVSQNTGFLHLFSEALQCQLYAFPVSNPDLYQLPLLISYSLSALRHLDILAGYYGKQLCGSMQANFWLSQHTAQATGNGGGFLVSQAEFDWRCRKML